MSLSSRNLITVLILINLISGAKLLVCQTPSNTTGICIRLRDCSHFYNLIANSGRNININEIITIRSSWCGVEDRQNKICCPIETMYTTTTSRTSPISNPIARHRSRIDTDFTTHPNIELLPKQICGYAGFFEKMAGSNKTDVFDNPWMAIILYQDQSNGQPQFCGGSLINKRYVLTAAHCISNGTNVIAVVLGEHDTETETDCDFNNICAPRSKTIIIEEVIPHPDFRKGFFLNDIGLIRLNQDIDFLTESESIRPICLPTTNENINEVVTRLKVTGWGLTENKTASSILLQALMIVVPNNICQSSYEPRVKITSFHLCAGGSGVDSCSGDSGGPAIYPTNTPYGVRFVQFGIVSGGNWNCGSLLPIPGLYTKVVPYMQWILDNIRE